MNLENLQRRAIANSDTKLNTPGSITEIGQLVEFRRGRWGCFSLIFLVRIMGKVIEVLNCLGQFGVKRDSVFISDGKVLLYIKGGLIVLLMGSITVI